MNVGVVGSRTFTNYSKLVEVIKQLGIVPTCIVSGGAVGADSLAEQYAKENNVSLVVFSPEYGKFGKQATLNRNQQIVNMSDVLIAFPTQLSRGTWHTVGLAKAKGIPVHIVELDKRFCYLCGKSCWGKTCMDCQTGESRRGNTSFGSGKHPPFSRRERSFRKRGRA